MRSSRSAAASWSKVGFDDRKIVYYFLEDLERDDGANKRTFHDLPE